MRSNNDLYKIIQVHPTAEKDMISYAYKKLSKKYHPDINKSKNAEEMMKRINHAYDILSDSEKRSLYDNEYCLNFKSNETSLSKQLINAQTVLEKYFKFLMLNKYDKSYNLLCAEDKNNISSNAFGEWQMTVSKLYEINDYEINRVDDFYNKKIGVKVFTHVVEFRVEVEETDLRTGLKQVEGIERFIVFEEDEWKVLLGYKKIDEYVKKLKVLSKSLPEENDEFKNEKYKGFLKNLEQEVYRHIRYNREYSLILFEVKNMDEIFLKLEGTSQEYIANAIIKSKIVVRFLDSILRFGKRRFFVLLPETNKTHAKHVAGKFISHFKKLKPYKIDLDYVLLQDLDFSATELVDIATAELIILKSKARK